jgi:DNA-binding transcriptional LysR family regulator
MSRNETRYMESVIAVAEELNFTLAAQKIHISQPMVSRNVAELETKLGGRLFERDRKKVQLNKAGRAYVEQARIALFTATEHSRPPVRRCTTRMSSCTSEDRRTRIPS